MLALWKKSGVFSLVDWFFFFRYDLKKRVNDMEMQKEKINEETKDVNEKSSKLADEMETKNKALKELEK